MKADAPEHDEFLRAALRHAPDHALTPPSGVSQTILAAARRVHLNPRPASEPAAAPRAPVRRHVPWHERMQWLLTPRWAGSLATGLVGALVLGLWFEQDLPGPTVSGERGGPIAHSESTAPAAPPAPAPAPPATTSPPAPPAQDSATRSTGTPEQARQGGAAPRPRGDAAPKRTEKTPDSAVAADTPPKAEAESALRREVPAARAATNEARMQAAPAPAAAPEAATAPRRAADAAAARADSPGPSGTLPDAPPAATAKLGAAASATGASAAASPALTLWRRSTAESTARSAIWTWQPGDAPSPRSFDADAQAWLLRLVQAARGRWIDVAEVSNGQAATEVRWWRDDQPHARLRIESEGLRWIEPGGRIRYAPMEPAALARLRGF